MENQKREEEESLVATIPPSRDNKPPSIPLTEPHCYK